AAFDARNQQLCADATTYLPHQLLALLDRTTMAVSIEGRVPYLDHRVAELALAIPGRGKYRGAHGSKWWLRRLARRHLPAGVTSRRKLGFPNSVPTWLSPSRLPDVRERLLDRGSFVAGGRRFVQFAGLAAIARLLAEQDIGLFGIVLATIAAIEALTAFTGEQSQIHSARGAERAYVDTVFTVRLLRGLLVGGALAALAPAFAWFFTDPAIGRRYWLTGLFL